MPPPAPSDDAICIIHNPIAGTRQGIDLREMIARAGRKIRLLQTQGPGDGRRLAEKAMADGHDIIVAAGGDGTVNEVANGLMGSNSALGIIPLGSGNGLARHLGIPRQPAKALAAIGRNNFTHMDAGSINGRPFFCTAGIGFDAHVSRHFAQSGKRGLSSYLRTTLTRYAKYTPVNLTAALDEGAELHTPCFLMTFANASEYGNGAFIAPQADISDGLLDLCLIDRLPLWRAVRLGLGLMTKQLPRLESSAYYKARSILVESDADMEYHADGDFIGTARSFTVAITPNALRVAL